MEDILDIDSLPAAAFELFTAVGYVWLKLIVIGIDDDVAVEAIDVRSINVATVYDVQILRRLD